MAKAQARTQLEQSLPARFSEAFSIRSRTRLPQLSCGLSSLDDLLHGGVPVGALLELVGTPCSGRTTMALTYLAKITHNAGVVAWIDVADTVDPASAAACGVDLERLLWVRCGIREQAILPPRFDHCPAKTFTPSHQQQHAHTGGGSPHPRSEGRNMSQAIGTLLASREGLRTDIDDQQTRKRKRGVGTPGAPNRSIANRPKDRAEQVNSDRLPPRRGENLVLASHRAEPRTPYAADVFERASSETPDVHRSAGTLQKPWPLLDQSLRIADLLLQGGGFSAIVFDLGSIPPETAWRIPLATWFRFRAACERTRTSVILLTQHPCARSSAELVVRLQTGRFDVDGPVIKGVRYQAATERACTYANEANVVYIRKPAQSVRPGPWSADATWSHAK